MAEYRKQFFEQCLVAMIAELERVEEQHPGWPKNVVNAARIVSEKAEKLLTASVECSKGNSADMELVFIEATQTGATALKFLLNMDNGFIRGGTD